MKLYRPTKRNDDDNTLGEAWVQIIFHSKNGNKRKYEAEVVQPRDCVEDSEGIMLRRLSGILTGGNASTWEQIVHAAESLQPRDCGEDTALVREIAEESGIEFSDERVRYVTVQMTKSTWYKLQARFAAMNEQTPATVSEDEWFDDSPAAKKPDSPLVENYLRMFVQDILHGDEVHRAWLLEAVDCFIEGKHIPEPKAKTPIQPAHASEQGAVEQFITRLEEQLWHDGQMTPEMREHIRFLIREAQRPTPATASEPKHPASSVYRPRKKIS